MKKLIVLTMILSLVFLCGCKATIDVDLKNTDPTSTDPAGSEPTGGVVEGTKPIEWETPIDIDDSFLQQPENTDPVVSDPTAPDATEPGTTDPALTDPATTDPVPTDPAPTEPEPTKPSGSTGSKPIELPMIPG